MFALYLHHNLYKLFIKESQENECNCTAIYYLEALVKQVRPRTYVLLFFIQKIFHTNSKVQHHIMDNDNIQTFITVFSEMSNLSIHKTFIFMFHIEGTSHYIRRRKTIVRKGVAAPPPLFKAHPPLDSACPLFLKSLFPFSSFLFHSLLRYFRQFPPLSRIPLLP